MNVFLLFVCFLLSAFCGMAAGELWNAGFHFAALAILPIGVIAAAVAIGFRFRH